MLIFMDDDDYHVDEDYVDEDVDDEDDDYAVG
jgi:hypothetical protein